jgi:hypothetical protein
MVAMVLCGDCKMCESDPNAPGRIIEDFLDRCEHRDCPLSEVILIRDWDAEYNYWLIEYQAKEELTARTEDTAKRARKPKQKGRKGASTSKE